jgi:hypothetical protein
MQISWTVNLQNDFKNGKKHKYQASKNLIGLYHPFVNMYLYYDKSFEEQKDKTSSLFDADKTEYVRRDGVSDFIFTRAKTQYGKNVTIGSSGYPMDKYPVHRNRKV